MNNDWKEEFEYKFATPYTPRDEIQRVKYMTPMKMLENFIQSEIDKAYKRGVANVDEQISEDKYHLEVLYNRMNEWIKEWRKEDYKKRKLTIPDIMNLINWKIDKAKKEAITSFVDIAVIWMEDEKDSEMLKQLLKDVEEGVTK